MRTAALIQIAALLTSAAISIVVIALVLRWLL